MSSHLQHEDGTARTVKSNMKVVQSTTHSNFVGVSRSRNQWRSYIHVNGHQVFLGHFETEDGAARAHDHEARKLGRPTNLPYIDASDVNTAAAAASAASALTAVSPLPILL